MKPDQIRKLLGGFSFLAGGLWIWELVAPFLRDFSTSGLEAVDIGFLLTALPLMILPGAFAIWCGARLFKEMSDSSLKGVVGSLSVLGMFLLSGLLYTLFGGSLPESIENTVFVLIGAAVVFPVYLRVTGWFLHHFAGVERSHAELISRGVLILVAFEVWLLLAQLFDEFLRGREGDEYLIEQPWDFIALVGPIIVAYGLYRALVARLLQFQESGDGMVAGE
jgi:hypothetical protein